MYMAQGYKDIRLDPVGRGKVADQILPKAFSVRGKLDADCAGQLSLSANA